MKVSEAQERTRGKMGKINVGNKVWVDMSDWPAVITPHESGYAVVVGIVEKAPNFYCVKFLDMDKLIIVSEDRVTLADEKGHTQEDTMHDKHYRNAVVEPILVMQDFFSREELIGFLKGNILKYRLRMGHKGTEEDMKADYDKLCVYEMWLDIIKNGERIEL